MPTTYAIPDGRTAFAATTYTGTGASQTLNNAVNGVAFQPDLIWTKSRGSAGNHSWIDSVRGITLQLSTTAAGGAGTAAEVTDATEITAITSTGFTVGTSSGVGYSTNGSTVTYVGWQWKAGGTAVTNNDGSVASQVSANTTAGFSVVTFTAPASGNFSAGHGLGVTPGMVITKVRGRVTSWITWHNQLNSGSPGTTYYVELNTTGGQSTFASVWGSTGVTPSVIGMGVGASCAASDTIVAYCFAAVAGYSAFGSYTGNGDPNGPFVYLGFRPRWFMSKRSTTAGNDWVIMDTSRDTYNVANQQLYADLDLGTETNVVYETDFLSNGFKIRTSTASRNASGSTYIYMAFAENPFKFANAR